MQLVVGPYTGRIERRLGSRAQLQAGMACVLVAYVALFDAHATTLELLAPTVVLGLGLGLGLSSLANLIVAAVRQDQTGVATGVNTVMRTLGGAFGAQLATTCITASVRHGLPTDRGFTLAFGVCACALLVGVVSALIIPRAKTCVTKTRLLPKHEILTTKRKGVSCRAARRAPARLIRPLTAGRKECPVVSASPLLGGRWTPPSGGPVSWRSQRSSR